MFKWICFAVAVVFLAVLGWLVNDIRLQVRRSSQTVRTTGETVNEHLPAVVEKSQKTASILAERLPEIVERTSATTQTLADLAADIRQLKELAGVATAGARDENLVGYANSLLKKIEASGGTIGLKKKVFGSGLKDTLPAREWAAGARKEALFLTVVAKSRKELLQRLAHNKFGSNWYIDLKGQAPVPLQDWLKENHPESKDL